jgi:hypothetical protein
MEIDVPRDPPPGQVEVDRVLVVKFEKFQIGVVFSERVIVNFIEDDHGIESKKRTGKKNRENAEESG